MRFIPPITYIQHITLMGKLWSRAHNHRASGDFISMVSPFMRSAVMNEAIWALVVLPLIISSITFWVSSRGQVFLVNKLVNGFFYHCLSPPIAKNFSIITSPAESEWTRMKLNRMFHAFCNFTAIISPSSSSAITRRLSGSVSLSAIRG